MIHWARKMARAKDISVYTNLTEGNLFDVKEINDYSVVSYGAEQLKNKWDKII